MESDVMLQILHELKDLTTSCYRSCTNLKILPTACGNSPACSQLFVGMCMKVLVGINDSIWRPMPSLNWRRLNQRRNITHNFQRTKSIFWCVTSLSRHSINGGSASVLGGIARMVFHHTRFGGTSMANLYGPWVMETGPRIQKKSFLPPPNKLPGSEILSQHQGCMSGMR
jgi:hypothetical protein